MNHLQSVKRVVLAAPASYTNGATAAGYIDTLGHDYAVISVQMSAADVVSNKPSVLRILETDATQPTASTNYATITGFVSGTDYTIPSAITAATSISQPFAVFNIDCRNRKRYIRCEVSPQTTQVVALSAELGRSETLPAATSQGTVVVIG